MIKFEIRDEKKGRYIMILTSENMTKGEVSKIKGYIDFLRTHIAREK